jgi:hypothetical protein
VFGFAGKILHFDLTTGHPDVEEPPEERCRTYLGGSALGLYYLLRNTPAGADPYGPEIPLAVMLSGVTGGSVAGQSRCTAVAKLPLTGAVQDILGSALGTLRSAERRTAASRPTHRCLPTRRAQCGVDPAIHWSPARSAWRLTSLGERTMSDPQRWYRSIVPFWFGHGGREAQSRRAPSETVHRALIAREGAMGGVATRSDEKRKPVLCKGFAHIPRSAEWANSGS